MLSFVKLWLEFKTLLTLSYSKPITVGKTYTIHFYLPLEVYTVANRQLLQSHNCEFPNNLTMTYVVLLLDTVRYHHHNSCERKMH